MDSELEEDKAVANRGRSQQDATSLDSASEIVARVRDALTPPEPPIAESDSLLHTVIQHVQDAVILVGRDLRVIAINDAAIKDFSFPPQLRGSKLSFDLFADVMTDGLTGKPLDEGRWLVARVLRGESVQGEPRVITFPDGSRRDFLVQCSPIRGPDGEVEMGLIVGWDVTDEVVAREQLEELALIAKHRAKKLEDDRARLDTIIQSTPVPLVVVMRNREIQMYNSAARSLCRELGLGEWIERRGSFREVKGMELLDEEGDPVAPRHDPLTRSLRGETCSGHLLQVRSGHGPFKWLAVNSAPLQGTRGCPSGAVLAIHDVTEERGAQEQLIQVYQREHSIAEKLQTSFLPGGYQGIRGFQIGHSYQTALDEALVGGDFYDLFRLGEGRLGVVIADVAGKGLRAAVYTAMTKYMLRAYALEESAPELVLARLNEALTACTPPEVFVTLIYGILDARDKSLTYANAGHEQPILYSEGLAIHLDVTGRALGLMHGSSYTTRQVDLGDGDVVVMHTDGISDAGTGPDRLGTDAMLRIAETNARQPAQVIADSLLCAATDFCESVLSDDAVVLVIKAVDRED